MDRTGNFPFAILSATSKWQRSNCKWSIFMCQFKVYGKWNPLKVVIIILSNYLLSTGPNRFNDWLLKFEYLLWAICWCEKIIPFQVFRLRIIYTIKLIECGTRNSLMLKCSRGGRGDALPSVWRVSMQSANHLNVRARRPRSHYYTKSIHFFSRLVPKQVIGRNIRLNNGGNSRQKTRNKSSKKKVRRNKNGTQRLWIEKKNTHTDVKLLLWRFIFGACSFAVWFISFIRGTNKIKKNSICLKLRGEIKRVEINSLLKLQNLVQNRHTTNWYIRTQSEYQIDRERNDMRPYMGMKNFVRF